MGRTRRPWTKTKIRRVIASTYVAGYAAFRSREGWSIWLAGDGAGPSRRRAFVPARSLERRSPTWLKNQMLRSMRRAVESFEGVTPISGREAEALTRWCVRRTRSTRPKLQRDRHAADFKTPQTVYNGGYEALRSRRGWVVSLSSDSGTLRGRYLVPFKAFGRYGSRWRGRRIVDEILRHVRRVPGAQRTNDSRIPRPTS
jgi:hypothetical protein